MNRIGQLRQVAGMDLQDVADIVGIDVLEASMAERGIGLTHYDLVVAIADCLEVRPSDLYPDVGDRLEALEALPDTEDLRDAMMDSANADALRLAGIDPDVAVWYAIVTLQSGNERRYRLPSIEKERLLDVLTDAADRNDWLVFAADCRTVVARKAAITEIRFVNRASYAAFSSRESAATVVLVSPRSPRPQEIVVRPDEGDDHRPFGSFVASAAQGEELQKFLLIEDDGEQKLMSVASIELMEIPVGVLVPELYGDGPLDMDGGDGDSLEQMEVMGEA